MPEPLLGYRVLARRDHQFVSPYRGTPWLRGVNHATCQKGHPAPQPECQCGIYAHHHLTDITPTTDPEVVVAVVGWGERSCIHSDRWRVAHSEAIAVLAHPRLDRAVSEHCGRALGIPVLAPPAFFSYAAEFGAPRYKQGYPLLRPSWLPWWLEGLVDRQAAWLATEQLLNQVEDDLLHRSREGCDPDLLTLILRPVGLEALARQIASSTSESWFYEFLLAVQHAVSSHPMPALPPPTPGQPLPELVRRLIRNRRQYPLRPEDRRLLMLLYGLGRPQVSIGRTAALLGFANRLEVERRLVEIEIALDAYERPPRP